jgi:hypothetical protein
MNHMVKVLQVYVSVYVTCVGSNMERKF